MWDAHQNHYKKLLPLKHMFSVLARNMGWVNRFNHNNPSFTVYSWAAIMQSNVTGDIIRDHKTKATLSWWDTFLAHESSAKAVVVFFTQILLIALLIMGMDLSEFGSQVLWDWQCFCRCAIGNGVPVGTDSPRASAKSHMIRRSWILLGQTWDAACSYPPPPCNSYALVQATVGVGTVLIWYLILIRYKWSAAAHNTWVW